MSSALPRGDSRPMIVFALNRRRSQFGIDPVRYAHFAQATPTLLWTMAGTYQVQLLRTYDLQSNALIEPDRGRFSNSGRIVAYPDRTAFFGDYFQIGYTPITRLLRNSSTGQRS